MIVNWMLALCGFSKERRNCHLVRVEDDIDCRVGCEEEVVDLDQENNPLGVNQVLVSHHLEEKLKKENKKENDPLGVDKVFVSHHQEASWQ